MSKRDARGMAAEIAAECGKRSREMGLYDRIVSQGDTAKAETAEFLERRRRQEFVTTDDLRSYWNLSDAERCVAAKILEMDRGAAFLHVLRETGDQDAARRFVTKNFPIFDDTGNDDKGLSGDDRPLSAELDQRVDRYAMGRSASDSEAFRCDLEAASSFNALMRAELRAGRI